MSFKVGDKVRYIPGSGDTYTVRKVSQANTIQVTEGGIYWPEEDFSLIEVTPKVGDTIRATRGETVVVGRVAFHSPEFGTDIVLDGKTSASVRGEYEIEIIKPKVALPTGKFASIMVDAVLYTHFSNSWVTSSGSRYTDAEITRQIENSPYGDTFRVVFPGE